jgi:hypothetical protein
MMLFLSFVQVLFASCSTFIRDLIREYQDCSCDAVTIFLPDYEANTVKNLLSLMYTGARVKPD